MNKSMLWLLAGIGGIIGSWLPTLFGAGDFSGWSILWGTIGGLAGVWVGYKLNR